MRCRRHDCEEGLPALQGGLLLGAIRYGGLPDIDAKLEQFAVDPRDSPQHRPFAEVASLFDHLVGALLNK
jgi:hypothetical protein